MQSTLTPQETDPHDSFLIEPDVVLAARKDQALPDPVHDALSRLANRAAHTTPGVSASAPRASADIATAQIPAVDTTFRAAATGTPTKIPGQRSAAAKWAKNTFVAFLFALCSAIAAQTWKHHSDTIKPMIANWMPPFLLALTSPAATPAPAEQPDAAPVQAATAEQAAPAPPAPSPDATATAPAPATATAATESPAPSPSVKSMARDMATMSQQIEQLKAGIEQLKAGQAQMSRDIAKASEQNLRPRVATLPPRPVTAVRKPKPAYPPAQQAAATSPLPPPSAVPPAPPHPALSQPVLPPPQATVESDGGPVVRPPMPLQ